MREVPKELVTALRNLRRRHGGKIFDEAIAALASGEITLDPGKKGRPGLQEWERLAYAWSQIEARRQVYGLDLDEAIEAVAQHGFQFNILNTAAGGVRKFVRPTRGTPGQLKRHYQKAEKHRLIDPHFREVCDFHLDHYREWYTLKERSSG